LIEGKPAGQDNKEVQEIAQLPWSKKEALLKKWVEF